MRSAVIVLSLVMLALLVPLGVADDDPSGQAAVATALLREADRLRGEGEFDEAARLEARALALQRHTEVHGWQDPAARRVDQRRRELQRRIDEAERSGNPIAAAVLREQLQRGDLTERRIRRTDEEDDQEAEEKRTGRHTTVVTPRVSGTTANREIADLRREVAELREEVGVLRTLVAGGRKPAAGMPELQQEIDELRAMVQLLAAKVD